VIRGVRIDASLLIMLAFLVVLLGFAVARGGPALVGEGLGTGGQLLLKIAPQLVVGFALAGLVTVLLPSEALVRYVGAESGFLGLAIASVAGIATPGGPFLQFPLVAALMSAGAGVGPIAAYLTAWSLLGWNRVLVWELPLLGGPFTLARWAVSLLLPILVGMTVAWVLRATSR
jgi:uncharacterized membrane protein YraQ (UPF0718 family)